MQQTYNRYLKKFMELNPVSLPLKTFVEMGLITKETMRNYVICKTIDRRVKIEGFDMSKVLWELSEEFRVSVRQIRNIYNGKNISQNKTNPDISYESSSKKFLELTPEYIPLKEIVEMGLITKETMRNFIICKTIERKVCREGCDMSQVLDELSIEHKISSRQARNIYNYNRSMLK